MNLFKRIFTKTLTYKIYDVFYSAISYVKDYNTISDTLYSDNFKLLLKRYLNVNFKTDWIGRLYGVINPNVDINGHINFNNTVIELDDTFTNNNDYVKHFIFKQLNMIADLFKLYRLYDYIDMRLEHVGPMSHDNYLIVFDIVSRKETVHAFKRMLKHALTYGVIFIIAYFANIYIF